MPWEGVTAAWCEANGFIKEELRGYVRRLSQARGSAAVDLVIGNYPFNATAVTLLIDGYGVMTTATSRDDILTLVGLFQGVPIDCPYEPWPDAAELGVVD